MKRLLTMLICMSTVLNLVGCGTDSTQTNSEVNQEEYSDVLEIIVQEEFSEEDDEETKTSENVQPEETFYPQKENALIKSLDFDSEDAIRLEKIAYAEARGESVECMALVMLVVLNRVWSDEFPDSIESVITQDGQFSPVRNGSYYNAEPNEDTHEALSLVLHGWNESQNALYFESCNGDSWHSRNLTFLFECDGMRFYK